MPGVLDLVGGAPNKDLRDGGRVGEAWRTTFSVLGGIEVEKVGFEGREHGKYD